MKNDTEGNGKNGCCLHCGCPIIGRKRRYCNGTCRERGKARYQKVQWQCVECGKEGQGRRKRFCSMQCRLRATYHRLGKEYFDRRPELCPVCGSQFMKRAPDHYYCCVDCTNVLRRENRQKYVCGRCGQAFQPKAIDRLRYCSRECAFAAKAEQKEERAALLSIAKWAVGLSRAGLHRCSDCEKAMPFVKRKRCRPCELARAREAFKQSWKPQPKATRSCEQCGQGFDTYLGFNKRLCDVCMLADCRRRAHHLRCARLRGVESEKIEVGWVFDRDEWKCQLCGSKVIRMQGAGYHPRRATLDHIVPLSKGGSHTYQNVQCACYECNSLKGDKIVGGIGLTG